MSHRFGSMPLAAEMDSFEAEVSGHQDLMTWRKPEYGAIVAYAGQDAISCARLLANPADQGFFKKRQSEANIDDKTIPPKPATLVIFSSEQPRLAANSSTHNLSAAYHSDFACRRLRHPRLELD